MNGAVTLMFEGVPNWPDFSRFWQVVDKHKVEIFYAAPPALRALMREGDEVGQQDRPLHAAPARLGGRADQSRGVGVVLPRRRRRPLPDRRHLVADRDRRPHDHPCPARPTSSPAAPRTPIFGVEPAAGGWRRPRAGGRDAEGKLVLTRSWPGQMRTVCGDHGRFFQTYFSALSGQVLHRRWLPPRRRTATLDHRPRRRRDQRLRPPHGHGRDRERVVAHPTVAEAAVVGMPHALKGRGSMPMPR